MAFLKPEEHSLIPESQIGDDFDHHLSDTNSMFRILRAGMFLSSLLKKRKDISWAKMKYLAMSSDKPRVTK